MVVATSRSGSSRRLWLEKRERHRPKPSAANAYYVLGCTAAEDIHAMCLGVWKIHGENLSGVKHWLVVRRQTSKEGRPLFRYMQAACNQSQSN